MLKKLNKSNILKLLARLIPQFPVILITQDDILKAEESGDLSLGMLKKDANNLPLPQLPYLVRNLISLFAEHFDGHKNQVLFFAYADINSFPPSKERMLLREDTRKKTAQALLEISALDRKASHFFCYLDKLAVVKDPLKIDNALEYGAKTEFINILLRQWDKELNIDNNLIDLIDDIKAVFISRWKLFIPCYRKRAERAKKKIEQILKHDEIMYHHAFVASTLLWKAIIQLCKDINTPAWICQFKCVSG